MAYETTEVPVERSQGEIRRLLYERGAANFTFGEAVMDGVTWAAVEFVHHDQRVRIRVPHKPLDERAIRGKVQRAQTRTEAQIRYEFAEQEARRIWRVMFHGMKARLIAVEEGVETFEEAFLAHLVDPVSGRTIWEQAQGLIESGAMKVGGGGMAVGPPALGSGKVVSIVPPPDQDDDEVTEAEIVG